MKINSDGRFIKKVFVDDTFIQEFVARQAWYVGLMAADGHIESNGNISIAQSGENGLALIVYLQEMLGHTGSIYHGKTERQDSHTLWFNSKIWKDWLETFNVVAKKSLIYKYPIKSLPLELTAQFLRGYFDGDGSAGVYDTGKTKYPVLSFVGTLEFINECELRIPHRISCRASLDARNCHELRWYGEKALSFSRWLWEDQSLFSGYKQKIFNDFFLNNNPRYTRYSQAKKDATTLLAEGLSVPEVARRVGADWATIYMWRRDGIC